MSRPLRLEFPGALWHVTARGNERKPIYRDDEDRRDWLDLLGNVVANWNWVLHAYVLMPNHYHLFLETPEMTLSDGMRQLNGVYTQAFNRKYKRAGHLFQGRFKGILVSEDSHLVELLRYIVLNPVRAKLCQNARQWRWSSFRATAGMSRQPKCLNVARTLSMFSSNSRVLARRRYIEFVHSARDLEYQPWEHLRGQIYLGDDDFAKAMQARIEEKCDDVEIPRPQRAPARLALSQIAGAVCRIWRVEQESLIQQTRSDPRLALALLGRRFHYSQREVGGVLSIGRAGFSMMEHAAKSRYEGDRKFQALLDRCIKDLA